MNTLEVVTQILPDISPVGDPLLISLETNFDIKEKYKICKEDFKEVSHFEPNLQISINTELQKFEAGKSYECQLCKIESLDVMRAFVANLADKEWFVGGGTGLILFWEKVRLIKFKYKSGFCLSPVADYSQLPYMYKGKNKLTILGSRKDTTKKDEEKGFYTGKFILLFREVK